MIMHYAPATFGSSWDFFYSFNDEDPAPRKYCFCGSLGTGTTLEKLLNDAIKLKQKCREAWADKCAAEITDKQIDTLSGELEKYFDTFDFSFFSSKSVLETVQGHSKTQFHAIRFGCGLPPRPSHETPPDQPQTHESRYIRQLLEAYSNQAGSVFTDIDSLAANDSLKTNFRRQRKRFYHAQALRNFARDTVREDTFAQWQDEIHHGVVDASEHSHVNGFERMTAVVSQAATISCTSTPHSPVTKIQDLRGICHQ